MLEKCSVITEVHLLIPYNSFLVERLKQSTRFEKKAKIYLGAVKYDIRVINRSANSANESVIFVD